MGFMFVLVLAMLAAYTQATLTYGSRPTYGGRKPHVGVLGGSLGRLGSGYDSGYKPKYDAGRLVHGTVFNPRRVGRFSGFGGGPLVDRHGLGGHLGQIDCFPRCGYGEVCVGGGLKGRPYCQRKSPFLGGGSPVLGGSGIGGRRNVCYDYAYPNDCLSTSKYSSITRYTFYDGYCQEFSCDNGSHCYPQGHINNIFTSIRACQQYCRD